MWPLPSFWPLPPIRPSTPIWQVATTKPVVLREGWEMSSLKLGTVAPGSAVQVLEVVDLHDGIGSRRARTPQGWLCAAPPLELMPHLPWMATCDL
jgi:hypothetical protein